MPNLDPKLISVIQEQLQVSVNEITPEANFVEDLGADSMDMIELVMQLEESFGIIILDADAAKVRTVQDAADTIERLRVK